MSLSMINLAKGVLSLLNKGADFLKAKAAEKEIKNAKATNKSDTESPASGAADFFGGGLLREDDSNSSSDSTDG